MDKKFSLKDYEANLGHAFLELEIGNRKHHNCSSCTYAIEKGRATAVDLFVAVDDEIARLEKLASRAPVACDRVICEGRREAVDALESQVTMTAKKVEELEAEVANRGTMIAEAIRVAQNAVDVAEEFRDALAELDRQFGIACADRESLLEQRTELKRHVADQSVKIGRLEARHATQDETIRGLIERNAEANRRAETYQRQAETYQRQAETRDSSNGHCCREDLSDRGTG